MRVGAQVQEVLFGQGWWIARCRRLVEKYLIRDGRWPATFGTRPRPHLAAVAECRGSGVQISASRPTSLQTRLTPRFSFRWSGRSDLQHARRRVADVRSLRILPRPPPTLALLESKRGIYHWLRPGRPTAEPTVQPAQTPLDRQNDRKPYTGFMIVLEDRILLHLQGGRRLPVDLPARGRRGRDHGADAACTAPHRRPPAKIDLLRFRATGRRTSEMGQPRVCGMRTRRYRRSLR